MVEQVDGELQIPPGGGGTGGGPPTVNVTVNVDAGATAEIRNEINNLNQLMAQLFQQQAQNIQNYNQIIQQLLARIGQPAGPGDRVNIEIHDLVNIRDLFKDIKLTAEANANTEVRNNFQNEIQQIMVLINNINERYKRGGGRPRRKRRPQDAEVIVKKPLGNEIPGRGRAKVYVHVTLDEQGRPMGGRDLDTSKQFAFNVFNLTKNAHDYYLFPQVLGPGGTLLNEMFQAVLLHEDSKTVVRNPVNITKKMRFYVIIRFVGPDGVMRFTQESDYAVGLVAIDSAIYHPGVFRLPLPDSYHDYTQIGYEQYEFTMKKPEVRNVSWTEVRRQVKQEMAQEIGAIAKEEGAAREEITRLNQLLERINPIYEKISGVNLKEIFAASKIQQGMVHDLVELSRQVHGLFDRFDFNRIIEEQRKIHEMVTSHLEAQLANAKRDKFKQAEIWIDRQLRNRAATFDRMQAWLKEISRKITEDKILA